MEEKKELKSKLSIETKETISKEKSYKDMKCILGLDAKREKDFNSMKKIEVTKDELLKIGEYRWLLNI
jgi:hypothetical protein